jgi:hypothetical protein
MNRFACSVVPDTLNDHRGAPVVIESHEVEADAPLSQVIGDPFRRAIGSQPGNRI